MRRRCPFSSQMYKLSYSYLLVLKHKPVPMEKIKYSDTSINGKASLSPKIAIRVGKATNTTPESWLYMQAKLDLRYANKQIPKIQPFNQRVGVPV